MQDADLYAPQLTSHPAHLHERIGVTPTSVLASPPEINSPPFPTILSVSTRQRTTNTLLFGTWFLTTFDALYHFITAVTSIIGVL
jgi:hypothetical protein